MRDKAANIVLMLILNAMVIGTLVYKSRGGKVIDFSTSDGIITILFLVAMAAVDVLYAVKTDTRQREIRAGEQKRKKGSGCFYSHGFVRLTIRGICNILLMYRSALHLKE